VTQHLRFIPLFKTKHYTELAKCSPPKSSHQIVPHCYKVKHHSMNHPLICPPLEVRHCLQKSWLTLALLLYCFSIDLHCQEFLRQGKRFCKGSAGLNPLTTL